MASSTFKANCAYFVFKVPKKIQNQFPAPIPPLSCKYNNKVSVSKSNYSPENTVFNEVVNKVVLQKEIGVLE
jgi:hypothetical protein